MNVSACILTLSNSIVPRNLGVEGISFLTIFVINLSFPSFNAVTICFQDGWRARIKTLTW